MSKRRLWLMAAFIGLVALEEIIMKLFGKSEAPPSTGTVAPVTATTPAVIPGATPVPTNVASATTATSVAQTQDPVSPVTASAAAFPTAAPSNPNPGTVYPVPVSSGAEVKAPTTSAETLALAGATLGEMRKRISGRELIWYLIQFGLIIMAWFITGPLLTMTTRQQTLIIVFVVVSANGIQSFYWKFWVPDEKAAEHFGKRRGLDAFMQLLVMAVAFIALVLSFIII